MGGLLAQQTRLHNFRGMEAPPVPAATQQLFLSLEESLEIPRSLGTDSIVQVRRECVLNQMLGILGRDTKQDDLRNVT